MVSGILAYKFGAPFAWITSLSVGAYIAFTLAVTQVLCISQYSLFNANYDAVLAFLSLESTTYCDILPMTPRTVFLNSLVVTKLL